MLGVYAFCAIVGIPLLLLMAFAGGVADLDFDADVDFDLDLDADLDVDLDADLGDGSGLAGDAFSDMLSVRAVIFAMAAFGLIGLLATWTGVVFPIDVVLASVVAFGFAFASSAAMAWLKRSETSSVLSKTDVEGNVGKVTVPMEGAGRGKVIISLKGKPTAMTAQLFNNKAGSVEVGERVVVVEVNESGTALIARLDSLAND